MRRAAALGWTPVEHLGTPHFIPKLLQLFVCAQIQEHQPSPLVFLPNRLALVNNFALILYEKHMGRQIIGNSRLYPRPTLRKINHFAGNSCGLFTAKEEVRLDGHLFTNMPSLVTHGRLHSGPFWNGTSSTVARQRKRMTLDTIRFLENQ
jgi:hypothetical protein